MELSRRAFLTAIGAAPLAAVLPPACGRPASSFNGLAVDWARGPSSSAWLVVWTEDGVHKISQLLGSTNELLEGMDWIDGRDVRTRPHTS